MSHHVPSRLPDPCPNCTEPAYGRFCAGCGQNLALATPSLWQFFHEYLQNYVAAEGKLWRTLRALLLQPGRLTADHLEGRRARYVKPLALYLSCSFLLFSVFLTLIPVFKDEVRDAATGFARGLAGQDREGRALKDAQILKTPAPDGERVNRGLQMWADEVARQPGVLLQQVSLATFLSVSVLAFWFKFAYRRRRLNYGVHLLQALHCQSFSILTFILLYPLVYLPRFFLKERVLELEMVVLVSMILLNLAYVTLAARRVYGGRWWPQALRVVAISGLHSALWGITLLAWIFFSAYNMVA